MRFRTKKELLEYLGKNENDRKLIDRMMIRGEVSMISGGYEYNDPVKEEIEGLKRKIEELENKVIELNREKNDLIGQIISSGETSSDSDEIINKVYKYLTQVAHIHVDKTEFKEWLENN